MQLLLLPLVALAALLLLLALPVLLPVLTALAARDRRRLLAAAEATPCGRCGRPLGPAALDAADAIISAAFEDTLRHGFIPRIVRRVFARCTACGADHGWDEPRRTLHLLPPGPRDDRGPAG